MTRGTSSSGNSQTRRGGFYEKKGRGGEEGGGLGGTKSWKSLRKMVKSTSKFHALKRYMQV
jgi:hypothetical protein